MQEALSGKVVYGTPGGQKDVTKNIQIAGIEKGSKNRYNNIWPYEHSRVKLEGCEDGSCDYINANHIQAAYSNKRYIATQGPIPATFQVSFHYA
jgi:protein-tyrosine phosphatase